MNKIFQIASGFLRCTLSGLGASILSVQVKSAGNTWTDVALSPLNFETGAADPSLAGRTIAPCCGRVRDGMIEIRGSSFQLAKNEGAGHIHGGPHGSAFQTWQEAGCSSDTCAFFLQLPDGLDGYPGNRTLKAEYHIAGRVLKVCYSAVTDLPTWIDMTSHVYWDLSGRFDGSALDQQLEIPSDLVVRNDAQHFPLSIADAEGPFDFRHPVSPRELMLRYPSDQQLSIGRGYNHAFLLSPGLPFAARLYCPDTGIRMTMRTDQTALVFYSGGFLDHQTELKNGRCVSGCALALEAQGVPDPFHLPGQSAFILFPGKAYQRTISWEFDSPCFPSEARRNVQTIRI